MECSHYENVHRITGLQKMIDKRKCYLAAKLTFCLRYDIEPGDYIELDGWPIAWDELINFYMNGQLLREGCGSDYGIVGDRIISNRNMKTGTNIQIDIFKEGI